VGGEHLGLVSARRVEPRHLSHGEAAAELCLLVGKADRPVSQVISMGVAEVVDVVVGDEGGPGLGLGLAFL